eukprot:SAG31_NODE_522_length_14623_cov_6.071674_9_plen_286_part_00
MPIGFVEIPLSPLNGTSTQKPFVPTQQWQIDHWHVLRSLRDKSVTPLKIRVAVRWEPAARVQAFPADAADEPNLQPRVKALRYRERLGKRELGRLELSHGLQVRVCNRMDLVQGRLEGEPPALLSEEVPLVPLEGGGWAAPDTHFEILDRNDNHIALFRSESCGKRGRYDVITWVKALQRALQQQEDSRLEQDSKSLDADAATRVESEDVKDVRVYRYLTLDKREEEIEIPESELREQPHFKVDDKKSVFGARHEHSRVPYCHFSSVRSGNRLLIKIIGVVLLHL